MRGSLGARGFAESGKLFESSPIMTIVMQNCLIPIAWRPLLQIPNDVPTAMAARTSKPLGSTR